MSIETILRDAFQDAAADAAPVPGLAAAALRQARRRRTAARSAVAAGAMAAVAVPAGLAASGRDDDSSTVASGDADILPAPEVRELTDDELMAAVDTCFAGHQDPTEDWDSIHGVQLVEPASPEALSIWVIAGPSGEELVWCALPSGGDGLPQLRMAQPMDVTELLIVDEGLGAGSYADPVTRVTVQYADGPEQDAVLWNGFWFDPMGRARLLDQDEPCEGPLPYVVRAYADDGEVLAELTDDGVLGGVGAGSEPPVATVTCQP